MASAFPQLTVVLLIHQEDRNHHRAFHTEAIWRRAVLVQGAEGLGCGQGAAWRAQGATASPTQMRTGQRWDHDLRGHQKGEGGALVSPCCLHLPFLGQAD